MRAACAAWLERRFAVRVSADTMVLPVNGTREALFSFVQAVVSTGGTRRSPWSRCPIRSTRSTRARRCWPAPSRCSSTPSPEQRFQPDLDAVPAETWDRCQVLFLCSPGNPTGAVLSLDYLRHALELAERHDFVIASDECYAELYRDEAAPPPSLLQAAVASGHDEFQRCMVFHSLSKRSSVPGLRSGFVAGDPALIKPYLLYRTYHGCAMPVPTQLAIDRGLERRRACRGESRPVPRKIRARRCPYSRPCWTWSSPTAPSTCGRTCSATTKRSRASCLRGRI